MIVTVLSVMKKCLLNILLFITVLSFYGVYKCKINILKTKHLPNVYVQYHRRFCFAFYLAQVNHFGKDEMLSTLH